MSNGKRTNGVYTSLGLGEWGYYRRSQEARINWGRIGRAIAHYESRGYRYIEVPWYVPEEYIRITYPFMTAFKTAHGDLVGSAEQAFLYLSAEGRLQQNQKYVACSPCFRDNQPDDELHSPAFMKVELYWTKPPLGRLTWGTEPSVGSFMMDAAMFFASEGGIPEYVQTKEGWDINIGGIEVGSYGQRKTEFDERTLKWVYGTGLAEPRFSQAVPKQREYVRELTWSRDD